MGLTFPKFATTLISPPTFPPAPMALSPNQAFLALAAQDFNQLVTFYQALLGRSPQPLIADRYAEFQLSGGLRLAIFPPKPSAQAEFHLNSAGPLSLCLGVPDLAEALVQLQQLQCPHGEIQLASHGKEVYAYDPQGNRIILYQPNHP